MYGLQCALITDEESINCAPVEDELMYESEWMAHQLEFDVLENENNNNSMSSNDTVEETPLPPTTQSTQSTHVLPAGQKSQHRDPAFEFGCLFHATYAQDRGRRRLANLKVGLDCGMTQSSAALVFGNILDKCCSSRIVGITRADCIQYNNNRSSSQIYRKLPGIKQSAAFAKIDERYAQSDECDRRRAAYATPETEVLSWVGNS